MVMLQGPGWSLPLWSANSTLSLLSLLSLPSPPPTVHLLLLYGHLPALSNLLLQVLLLLLPSLHRRRSLTLCGYNENINLYSRPPSNDYSRKLAQRWMELRFLIRWDPSDYKLPSKLTAICPHFYKSPPTLFHGNISHLKISECDGQSGQTDGKNGKH